MQRHDADPVSLVFGSLFTIAGLMLLNGDPTRGTVWLGWVGPAVAVGVGLLVALAVRPRREKPAAGVSAEDEG
jgi:cytochrome c-type biogenesis protein CcmH/NrfF